MYNTIKLENELYGVTGKSFTQALSELDPDVNYKGTDFEGLDAFERQLKRFDIKISGKNSDKVEKFFQTAESSVLFPEYVRRTIKQGMEESSIFPDIAASISYIDAIDFRSLTASVNNAASTAEQATELKTNVITLASPAKAMTKYGRGLSFSYESIRKQRLDTVGVLLKRMGAQIAREMNNAAITEITKGLTAKTIAGTQLTYNDLASFWASMGTFNMSTLVVSPATLAKILSLDEMKNCEYDYVSGNAVKTPFGVTLVKCVGMSDDTAVGIDRSCGVEVVFGTDLIIETDKEILKQSNMVTASITAGFTKLCDGSVLTIKTTK